MPKKSKTILLIWSATENNCVIIFHRQKNVYSTKRNRNKKSSKEIKDLRSDKMYSYKTKATSKALRLFVEG